jgi:hypothetical protein
MLLSAEVWFMPLYKIISAALRWQVCWSESLFQLHDGAVKACCRNIGNIYGYMNTAVLPVATFESQIEIVSKVLGSFSKC